ncbi:hypothetical protein IP92_03520 [Pseudoduganella flava]|uniref:Pilus assembly protein n=1 Tax=Pseudoduganella flava TaxID=871742 RepID=A0A562PNT8_9BURK|nr:hypothetical protein [Pseudoduganella flava]QGZ40635.1 hypothetical protein GO485_17255 [Pseudoduganella flava]TWI46087.1 hypothetical protein IP92_03520 [Pseudoduganella flava]
MIGRDRREQGTAAIEMVLVLVFGMVLLAGMVLFGRLTMHMIALEKAIGNTTRIVATLPRPMLTAENADLTMPALGARLVRDATLSAGLDIQPRASSIGVLCEEMYCGTGVATTMVSVSTNISFTDTVFRNAYTATIMPASGSLPLSFKYSELCAIPFTVAP